MNSIMYTKETVKFRKNKKKWSNKDSKAFLNLFKLTYQEIKNMFKDGKK